MNQFASACTLHYDTSLHLRLAVKSLKLWGKMNFRSSKFLFFHLAFNYNKEKMNTQYRQKIWVFIGVCDCPLAAVLLVDSLPSVVSHLQLYSPPIEFHHIVKLQLLHVTHWCVGECMLSMFSLMNLLLQFLILTAHADHYPSPPYLFRIINLTFFLGRVLIFNWEIS